MDPTDLSDAQLDQLADQLAGRLPSGTHGDRVVLSRRAFAAAVGGTLGASGLVALGVDPAAAQAAGQVGTSADPVDAFVYDLDVANALQSDLDAGGNALTNVESLSTATATIGQEAFYEDHDLGTIQDDSVASFDAKANTNSTAVLEVITSGLSPNVGGVFISEFSNINAAFSSNMTNVNSGSLSGTTGPDGTLNISRDGNTVYVENRTGAGGDVIVLQRAFNPE